MRASAAALLVAGAAAANGTRVRGHGFSFDATAVVERRALPVDAAWRVRLHKSARLKKPAQLTVVECRNASVPLYCDTIWGCGRRSPAARQWRRREWIRCDSAPLPGTAVVPGRTHLGLDVFSPTFQHEMVNGVQQLAGVWPRFLNDTHSRLLCHGLTCALAKAALDTSSRLVVGEKCRAYFFPVLEIALVRGDLLWPGAYEPFAEPYAAALLGNAPAACPATTRAAAAASARPSIDTPPPPPCRRRTVLYATRNHDAYHGKRLVVNESAVVAAVSAVASAADLDFVLFCFQTMEASARAFSAAAVVVAPHGGALANLVFCAPGTAVVEIVPPQTVRLFYAGLSYARGLRYYAFPAREFSYTGNVVVDPAALAVAVRAAARGDEG